jgi:dTDP-4-amino-4,6-dideoxygalactose transaminase
MNVFQAFNFLSANNRKPFNHWCKSDDICLSFSRSAFSIKLITSWRQRIYKDKDVIVWLPDFFCNESLVLLRQLGVKIIFYPVDELCNPSWSKFPTKILDFPDLFFLVHYFGKPSPSKKAIEFCKLHNAWLVEDAAHALEPETGIGDFGDIVLYSPHKHFSIPDGALLIVRDNGPSELGLQEGNFHTLFDMYSIMASGPRRLDKISIFWFIKRLLQVLGVRAKKKKIDFNLDSQPILTNEENAAMSKISNKLLNTDLERITTIRNHRKDCAKKWALSLEAFIPNSEAEFKDIDFTPYLTYITFKDHSSAKFFFDIMQKASLPVSTWPDLPQEVINSKVNHLSAFNLRHSRIYLPVHQTVSYSKIDYYVKKLNKTMIKKRYV